MEYLGIIISGTMGAGKSDIARKLCEKSPHFQLCKAVTTREQRQEGISEYDYVSEDIFTSHRNAGELLADIKYSEKYYVILSSSVKAIIDSKKIPILVVAPKCVKTINEKMFGSNQHYLSFFIDSEENNLNDRLERRDGYNKSEANKLRRDDRAYAPEANYLLQNNGEINDVVELIFSIWEFRHTGGLLPHRIIQLMLKCGILLKNADINKIQGASYDLTLGDDYCQNGAIDEITPYKPYINIAPGDYAVVSSKEIANFPKDVAGRYDLTVSSFVKGLILSNGPQVDPGFSGALLCTLFNASNTEISFGREDHYATIEFIKLIEPTFPYKGQYQNKEAFWQYIKEKSSPGLYAEIKKLQEDINMLKQEKWYIKNLPLVLAVLAIIIAVIKS